ncbi:MAG: WecB/TagA/CpsF family glycosyltransferase [Clostridia bacterium]|nr:WecB/TagA/CpsF family glycosyltransferase [Clostridia bacterium]
MKKKFGPVCLDVGGRDEILADCRALIGRGGRVFTVNALMWERAHRSPEFAEALGTADVLTVDGVGVKWALEKNGVRTEVLSGVSLGELIIREGAPSLAIIGGKEGVAERALRYLKAKNPRLRESFTACGYGYADGDYIELLRYHRPKLCFVCLGSPRQEYFAVKASSASPKTLFFALGGSLDVYSGEKRRAPRGVREAGFEWLYRMLREPKRLKGVCGLARFAMATLIMAKNSTKSGKREVGN